MQLLRKSIHFAQTIALLFLDGSVNNSFTPLAIYWLLVIFRPLLLILINLLSYIISYMTDNKKNHPSNHSNPLIELHMGHINLILFIMVLSDLSCYNSPS